MKNKTLMWVGIGLVAWLFLKGKTAQAAPQITGPQAGDAGFIGPANDPYVLDVTDIPFVFGM